MSKPATSETQYLRQQADDAQRAIARTLESIKSDLLKSADIRPMARRHPLGTVGAAAGLGFVAALLAIPPRTKRQARPEQVEPPGEPPPKPPSSKRGGRTAAWIVRQALQQLRPVLLSALTAAIHQYASRPPESNGQAKPASDPTPRTVPADDQAGDPGI